MDHYFTDNRHLAENRKEISFRFWCFTYTFITDNGVFSKDSVDFGTRVLLKTLCDRNELGEHILECGLWLWRDWHYVEKNLPQGTNGNGGCQSKSCVTSHR